MRTVITLTLLLLIIGCQLDEVTIVEPNRYSVPNPPELLSAVIVDSSDIQIRWKDNSDNEDGFRIYNAGFIVPENTTSIFYSDWSGMQYNIAGTYHVSIAAINRGGESPGSERIRLERIDMAINLYSVTGDTSVRFGDSLLVGIEYRDLYYPEHPSRLDWIYFSAEHSDLDVSHDRVRLDLTNVYRTDEPVYFRHDNLRVGPADKSAALDNA